MMGKINKMRSKMHKTERLLGDLNAFNRGKIFKRIKNRIIGRWLNGLMKWK